MFYKGPFSRFPSYHIIEVTFCEEKSQTFWWFPLPTFHAGMSWFSNTTTGIYMFWNKNLCLDYENIWLWNNCLKSIFLLNPGRHSSLHFHECLCTQAPMVYDYWSKHSTVRIISLQKADKWHGFRFSKAQEHFFRLVKMTVINILEMPR